MMCHRWLPLVAFLVLGSSSLLPIAAQGVSYNRPGPCRVTVEKLTLRLPAESNCTGLCTVPVSVYLPGGRAAACTGARPVVYWFNAFQAPSVVYVDYLKKDASYGIVAVAYDLGLGIVTDRQELGYRPFLLALLAAANADSKSPLYQRLNLNLTATAGHSRGGKLASLVLASDPRVKTAVLLDPVDNTVFSPVGPDYPSAVAALAAGNFTAAVAGAGVANTSCNPASANYQRFLGALQPGSWQEVIAGANHVSYLAPLGGVGNVVAGGAALFCGKANTTNRVVVAYSSALMAAWLDGALNGAPTAAFIASASSQQAKQDGVTFSVKA